VTTAGSAGPPRLLGLVVANPGAAESVVFSRVLAHRAAAYEPLVIHQDSMGGRDSTISFRSNSRASVVPIDLGWRPSHGRPRRRPAKAASLLRLFAAAPSVYRASRAFHPTLVYSSQQRWDSLIAAQIAQRLGLPHVVHLHYNVEPSLGPEVLRRLGTRAHIVAVSDFIREQAIAHGIEPERVTTIRNAIAPSRPIAGARESVLAEFHFPADTLLVGTVARLAPSKGQDDVIAAFATLLAEFPAARLLVVGDGEDRERLERLVAQLGVARAVRFTGQRTDVPRVLDALDVFVHPSRREPFGLAVLEAMAAGKPVVASTDGAFPEFVDDGMTGLLVPPGDVAQLACVLRRLLANASLRVSLGAAARCRVEKHFRPEDAGRAFGAVVRAATAVGESSRR
jgi:glycosyltransferase involved in cell wall biosynthesis